MDELLSLYLPLSTPFEKGSLKLHLPTKSTKNVLMGCYWIDKKHVDLPQMTLTTDELSYSILTNHPDGIHVGVPKFYGISAFGKGIDRRINGKQIECEHNIKLRDEQLIGCTKTIKTLEDWGGAFFIADCGFGKSVCIAYLISQLKRRSIIVVPRLNLMEQMKLMFKTYLPSTSVGLLHGKMELPDDDVVIVCIDSLLKYPQTYLDSFGAVFFDEAHHLVAQTLCKILPHIQSKYIIAFSATPDRRDGLEYALYWLLGTYMTFI